MRYTGGGNGAVAIRTAILPSGRVADPSGEIAARGYGSGYCGGCKACLPTYDA